MLLVWMLLQHLQGLVKCKSHVEHKERNQRGHASVLRLHAIDDYHATFVQLSPHPFESLSLYTRLTIPLDCMAPSQEFHLVCSCRHNLIPGLGDLTPPFAMIIQGFPQQGAADHLQPRCIQCHVGTCNVQSAAAGATV